MSFIANLAVKLGLNAVDFENGLLRAKNQMRHLKQFTGEESALGQLANIGRGAGVVVAFRFMAQAINRVTSGIVDANVAAETGRVSWIGYSDAVARSIPIFQYGYEAARDIRSLLDGSAVQSTIWREQVKQLADQAELWRNLRREIEMTNASPRERGIVAANQEYAEEVRKIKERVDLAKGMRTELLRLAAERRDAKINEVYRDRRAAIGEMLTGLHDEMVRAKGGILGNQLLVAERIQRAGGDAGDVRYAVAMQKAIDAAGLLNRKYEQRRSILETLIKRAADYSIEMQFIGKSGPHIDVAKMRAELDALGGGYDTWKVAAVEAAARQLDAMQKAWAAVEKGRTAVEQYKYDLGELNKVLATGKLGFGDYAKAILNMAASLHVFQFPGAPPSIRYGSSTGLRTIERERFLRNRDEQVLAAAIRQNKLSEQQLKVLEQIRDQRRRDAESLIP